MDVHAIIWYSDKFCKVDGYYSTLMSTCMKIYIFKAHQYTCALMDLSWGGSHAIYVKLCAFKLF
jgi:hypothetical protein